MVSITKVDSGAVDWEKCPYASAFTNPAVLSCLAERVDWWVAKKGNEELCFWPIALNDGSVQLPLFSYHVGPIWTLAGSRARKGTRSLSAPLSVYNGFLEAFGEYYQNISASLGLDEIDVRAFDWWNFGEADSRRLRVKPRYTAQLDFRNILNEEELIQGYRELRRRELRKARKSLSFIRCSEIDWDILKEMYSQTVDEPVESSGISLDKLRALSELDCTRLLVLRDATHPAEVLFAALLLFGHSTANLILNLQNSRLRGRGIGALGIHETLLAAKREGATKFDFNGANSPKRGDDKHSYGAEPRLFFEIEGIL